MTKEELLQAIDDMPMDAIITISVDDCTNELTSVDYIWDSNTIELY